ncbi:hypothetical protein NDU88_002725 [Pleurodeles waltl]|uniref:Uncharacterized protein n=1 Tax=Pleurodeles waltl TaxID=8319 RepID=A0AAV7KTM4_PLEWA|nr:hypothetical protein NDU88_002725 [Pleurodeles waltl]
MCLIRTEKKKNSQGGKKNVLPAEKQKAAAETGPRPINHKNPEKRFQTLCGEPCDSRPQPEAEPETGTNRYQAQEPHTVMNHGIREGAPPEEPPTPANCSVDQRPTLGNPKICTKPTSPIWKNPTVAREELVQEPPPERVTADRKAHSWQTATRQNNTEWPTHQKNGSEHPKPYQGGQSTHRRRPLNKELHAEGPAKDGWSRSKTHPTNVRSQQDPHKQKEQSHAGEPPRTTTRHIRPNRGAGPRTGWWDSSDSTAPLRTRHKPRAHSQHRLGSSLNQENGDGKKKEVEKHP